MSQPEQPWDKLVFVANVYHGQLQHPDYNQASIELKLHWLKEFQKWTEPQAILALVNCIQEHERELSHIADLLGCEDFKETISLPSNLANVIIDRSIRMDQMRIENRRLREGRFTEYEFQGLCHNLPENCKAEDFDRGCREYMNKLFGFCPSEEKIKALQRDRWDLDETLP